MWKKPRNRGALTADLKQKFIIAGNGRWDGGALNGGLAPSAVS
jgi:hypothetical protein